MPVSNAVREAKRRTVAQAQVDVNLNEKPHRVVLAGRDCLFTHINEMGTYSTKFMTEADQLVLAVDKIDAPEVKSGLFPINPDMAEWLARGNGNIGYQTRFSLNDGDMPALKILAARMEKERYRLFSFEDDFPEEGGESADMSYVLMYAVKAPENRGVSFHFDLYDRGNLCGSELFPSASAEVSVLKNQLNENKDYTTRIIWEYVVTVYTTGEGKPKDAAIKAEYLELQRFMRPIIVTLGILPTRL